jgi:hypothetical protein
MKWALTPNLPLGALPWYPNLDSLLKAAANDPQDVIAALPPWLRVLLSEDDERILIEAFTTTTRRNVMIHSKSVLKLINALLSRESKPPPPWMA